MQSKIQNPMVRDQKSRKDTIGSSSLDDTIGCYGWDWQHCDTDNQVCHDKQCNPYYQSSLNNITNKMHCYTQYNNAIIYKLWCVKWSYYFQWLGFLCKENHRYPMKKHTWPTTYPSLRNKMTENMDRITGTTTPNRTESFPFWLLSRKKYGINETNTFLIAYIWHL